MSLKKRHEVFNPYREALFLVRKVEEEGCFIKDYEDPEKAQEVVLKLNSLLSYDIEGVQNYGALVVRETEVNVFSYWNPISEEEENKILERKKRELWNKHSKKQPAWYKKYRQQQEEKRKQGSKYLK